MCSRVVRREKYACYLAAVAFVLCFGTTNCLEAETHRYSHPVNQIELGKRDIHLLYANQGSLADNSLLKIRRIKKSSRASVMAHLRKRSGTINSVGTFTVKNRETGEETVVQVRPKCRSGNLCRYYARLPIGENPQEALQLTFSVQRNGGSHLGEIRPILLSAPAKNSLQIEETGLKFNDVEIVINGFGETHHLPIPQVLPMKKESGAQGPPINILPETTRIHSLTEIGKRLYLSYSYEFVTEARNGPYNFEQVRITELVGFKVTRRGLSQLSGPSPAPKKEPTAVIRLCEVTSRADRAEAAEIDWLPGSVGAECISPKPNGNRLDQALLLFGRKEVGYNPRQPESGVERSYLLHPAHYGAQLARVGVSLTRVENIVGSRREDVIGRTSYDQKQLKGSLIAFESNHSLHAASGVAGKFLGTYFYLPKNRFFESLEQVKLHWGMESAYWKKSDGFPTVIYTNLGNPMVVDYQCQQSGGANADRVFSGYNNRSHCMLVMGGTDSGSVTIQNQLNGQYTSLPRNVLTGFGAIQKTPGSNDSISSGNHLWAEFTSSAPRTKPVTTNNITVTYVH